MKKCADLVVNHARDVKAVKRLISVKTTAIKTSKGVVIDQSYIEDDMIIKLKTKANERDS